MPAHHGEWFVVGRGGVEREYSTALEFAFEVHCESFLVRVAIGVARERTIQIFVDVS